MFDFPFTAVAGQQTLKRALTLVAVEPAIGGVLISGPRGSAKSTLARGMADILPVGDAGKPPFITLPLGASEEMLVGTLDLQQALNERQVQFQAGLLAKAHQGVLYVDEVNLLPDNLVDLLLDVAASGENIVERDGISHRHAARFILLGTMNADEGELRPQLQDRFGLAVALDNQYTLPERIEIVRLREAFDASPATFVDACSAEQLALKHQIGQARRRLPEVQCDDSLRWQIAERCQQARVDGLRADIVWLKAARAHAALHERLAVNLCDLDAVESLVLQHRRQAEPTPPPPSSPPPFSRPPESRPDRSGEKNDDHRSNSSSGEWGQMAPQAQAMVATDLCLTGLSARESDQGKHLAAAPLAANADRHRNTGKYGQGRRKLTQPGQKVNWFATCLKNLNMLKHSGRESAPRLQFHPRQGAARIASGFTRYLCVDVTESGFWSGQNADFESGRTRLSVSPAPDTHRLWQRPGDNLATAETGTQVAACLAGAITRCRWHALASHAGFGRSVPEATAPTLSRTADLYLSAHRRPQPTLV